MEWTYRIKAAAAPRVVMRIFQVIDQQMVPVQRCLLEHHDGCFQLTIRVEAEESLARRMHAKFFKQQDIEWVDLLPVNDRSESDIADDAVTVTSD